MAENTNDRASVKFDLWERKLLDLSTRNSLLNLKIKGNCVPLFVPALGELEDTLVDNKEYRIIPRKSPDKKEKKEEAKSEVKAIEPVTEDKALEAAPALPAAAAPAEPLPESKPEDNTEAAAKPEAKEEAPAEEKKDASKKAEATGIPAREYSIEDIANTEEFKEYITSEMGKGKLCSSLTSSDLDGKVKDLYRAAKSSIEENGASTLYLAVGFIKWFDKEKTDAFYAPIMLIPVELIRKSILLGYAMRKRDEDSLINITILEKLRQDFDIDVSELLGDLPTDEHGIDVDKVMELVEAHIAGMNGWSVIRSCVLGNFSFSQFVMWNDMHSHRNTIAKNKVVESLINGSLTWDAKNLSAMPDVNESEVLLPITADGSQLKAIAAATPNENYEGESFVLHGPPGTGKSQTITSIIANCLANGKTVLFAAEKKAALDVVYSRLDKIGIAPFCLELHSNKVRKSHVLNQLKEASEVRAKLPSSEDFEKQLSDITARRNELDKYVKELHVRRGCGMSLFELINMFAANENAPDVAHFDQGFVNEASEARVNEIEAGLGELVAASGDLGGKLSFVKATEFSQEAKQNLGRNCEAFYNAYSQFDAALNNFMQWTAQAQCSVMGTDDSNLKKKTYLRLASAIYGLSTLGLPASWLGCRDFRSLSVRLDALIAAGSSYLQQRNALSAGWADGFFACDGLRLQAEFNAANSKGGLGRTLGIGGVYKQVKVFDKTGAGKDNLGPALDALVAFQRTEASIRQGLAQDAVYLGGLYNPQAPLPCFDMNAVQSLNQRSLALMNEADSCDISGNARCVLAANQGACASASSLMTAGQNLEAAYNVLRQTYGFEDELFTPDNGLLIDKKAMIDELGGNADLLRSKITFNRVSSKCLNYKITGLIRDYEEGRIVGDQLVPAFRKEYAKTLVTLIIDSSETFRDFSASLFEEKISRLNALGNEFEKLTRQEIYLRIAKTLPNLTKDANAKSALGILQHAIKSGGRGVSIRTLFSKIGNIMLKLCPCVLMSPLSCAQYLAPNEDSPFDVVVFDEASQLPTCKAVGVIARGKNAVIVGDPKQMPPTSFFREMVFDDENYEIEDLESILDDCLAIGMPELHLLWHYRSRHESLITFSNKLFYEGKLYTFPSADDRNSMVTLEMVQGTFDSGNSRTNRAEAEAVVNEMALRCHDPIRSKQTLGVVTFNIQQQSLIEDLLDEKCKTDPELESWAFNGEEPVFIKNLENVQGDERDVILFSVGYGQDETGRMIMNFGPLNRDGGWRRLNVAVTRSRLEMKVFSSITADQIRISESSSEGVRALKRFLQYAAGSEVWDAMADGENVNTASSTPIIDRSLKFTGIADDICDRLAKLGYQTDRNIGKSGFKVDIGVVSPSDPGKYCLGILLDGKSYAEAGTTTSREISQISVLKGFGWNVIRIWSLEWWENPDLVISQCIEKIDAAENAKQEEAPASETPAEAAEPSEPEIPIIDGTGPIVEEETPVVEEEEQKKTLNPEQD
ncbi:MAG: DUF4011 domain-containing protein [Clostridiales bacterium]|nr:DUF4011 domain-containing protein [Clostridiales bacterium]